MSGLIILLLAAGLLLVNHQTQQAIEREQLLDSYCRIECKHYISRSRPYNEGGLK